LFFLKYDEVLSVLIDKLHSRGCEADRARMVGEVIIDNSLIGVASHGLNRFKRLILSLDNKIAFPDLEAEKAGGFGGFEIWDGRQGIGILNALICTDRVIELAREHGIGGIAMRNTNHWFRGGAYGMRIAEAGMAGILFTNTKSNMVYYGALKPLLGTTPLIVAIPRSKGPVVADVSLGEYSYGKLEDAMLKGDLLPAEGGYDKDGNLTRDPGKIKASNLVMPLGKHKGTVLSLALDLAAAGLSLGNTACDIRNNPGDEHAVSQVYIAINARAIASAGDGDAIIDRTLDQILGTPPIPGFAPLRYPGENAGKIRQENLARGVPVDKTVWEDILAL
jgi:3-dehydro-L-gulonate 2-dehydrogenase